MNPNQANNLLAWGRNELRGAGIASAWLDALLLMIRAVNGRLDKTALMTAGDDVRLSEDETRRFRDLTRRRAEHAPVAYLTEQCEFMGIPLQIREGVLIPRCDTETLAEEAIAWVQKHNAKSLLELCTGSGCVGIAAARYCGTLTDIVVSDTSPEALALAEQNARRAGAADRMRFIQSDLFKTAPPGPYDAVLANPPYIAADQIPLLPPSVKNFEPIAALLGGTDGLDFYRRIAADAKKFMAPGGILMLEIGYDQGISVPEILRSAGFADILVKKDLAGKDRVVSCLR